jgi:hypothetical protein
MRKWKRDVPTQSQGLALVPGAGGERQYWYERLSWCERNAPQYAAILANLRSRWDHGGGYGYTQAIPRGDRKILDKIRREVEGR